MQAENEVLYDGLSRVGSQDITGDQSMRYRTAAAGPLERAQEAGVVRDDLVAEDLLQLFRMLGPTTRSFSGGEPVDHWPRYLSFLLDAMRPAAATPLPPRPE